MSLGKDIQQKEFRNEYQKALINILYTNNFVVGKLNDALKEFDMTRQQFNVLRILRGQYPNPASVNLIKDRMLDKMSDSSRIVERLRVKGLIQREDCKIDKRAVEVTITQAGLELLQKIEQPINQLEDLVAGLSQEEATTLNLLLDKIRAAQPIYAEKEVQYLELD
jgi:DNA-binding MarR family transcriptional regulator